MQPWQLAGSSIIIRNSRAVAATNWLALSKHFGLSPSCFAQNLQGLQRTPCVDPLFAPEQMAAGFGDEARAPEVLSGARRLAALEISREPMVREFVRSIYLFHSLVTTRPTLKGAAVIDKLHPLAGIKWLTGKPLEKFVDEQWLRIEMAESEELLTVSITLPEEAQLLQKLQAAYFGELESEAWNSQRTKLLEEVIETLAPVIAGEMKAALGERARRWVASRCAEQVLELVSVAPYRRPDSGDSNEGIRVLACCSNSGWHDTTFVLLDDVGELQRVFTLGHLRTRQESEEQAQAIARLTTFIHDNMPNVCLVGAGSSQCCYVMEAMRKAVDGVSQLDPSAIAPEVVFGNEEVGGLYENAECSGRRHPAHGASRFEEEAGEFAAPSAGSSAEPDTAPEVVMACCVLHNFLLDEGDDTGEVDEDDEPPPRQRRAIIPERAGEQVRERLVAHLAGARRARRARRG